MNEAEIRAERIDPALKACGWGVVQETKVFREFHITHGTIQTENLVSLLDGRTQPKAIRSPRNW